MSRIQDILSKAERDGTARRTRALSDDGPGTPPVTDRGPRRRSRPTSRTRAAHRAGVARRRRLRPAVEPRRANDGLRDARSAAGRGARAAVARRRAVPVAAHAHQARRERPRRPRDRHHQPEQRRRQEPHGREPRAHDGAGVPAARAARRRGPPAPLGAPAVRRCRTDRDLSDVLMGAADLDEALVAPPGAPPDGAARGRAARPPGGAARVGLDAPRARHAAHALRSDPHRHAAGRAARRSAHRGADGRRRADDRPRRRHAEARDRTGARRARHVEGPRAGAERSRRSNGNDGRPTRDTGTSAVETNRITGVLTRVMQTVQPARLDAQPHGVCRRAAADLRIGGARRQPSGHARSGREPLEDRARHRRLPALPLLQRLLRPDAGPLEPRARRPPAAGGRGGLDRPGGAVLHDALADDRRRHLRVRARRLRRRHPRLAAAVQPPDSGR